MLGCQGHIADPEPPPYSVANTRAANSGDDHPKRRRAIGPFAAPSTGLQRARFECAHPEQRGAGQLAARRLTRDEYLRSARAVLGDEVVAAAEVQLAAAQIPGETSGDITQEFQNEHAYDHVFGIMTTAQALAKAVISDTATRKRVLGECAQFADRNCAAAYLAGDVRRILKRPLDEARRASVLNAFSDAGEGNDGLELVLARVLQAPEAVFHLAVTQEPIRERMFTVDAWTVAARVAYALTGRGPDDALLAAAESGELGSVEQVRPHALRLLESPDARTQLEAILDAWLDLQRLPTPHEAVASTLGIDPVALNEEARRELLDYAVYEILERDADAHTLMTAEVGFPRSERMSRLYGSERADGAEPVVLPHGHRGLLVRAAPLLSGGTRTSPILRGVYVRKRLLCDALDLPDFSAVQKRTEALQETDSTQLSAREHTQQLTAPSECMACHAQINPLGFALEGYDGFGASREVEITWSSEGSELATHALDTRVLDVNIEAGTARNVEGAADLVRAIATSAKYPACLAERLYTHAQLRPAAAEDACALSEIEAALRDGSSVREAWLLAALNEDTFVQRVP